MRYPRIGLVTILADDVDAMKAFYGGVLGFEVVEHLGSYVEFRSEGVRFAVCARDVMFTHTGHPSYVEEANVNGSSWLSLRLRRRRWTCSTGSWWRGAPLP